MGRRSTALLAGAALASALFVAGGITLAAAVPAGDGLPSAFADAGNTEHATCPGPPVCTREEYESETQSEEESSPPPEETSEPQETSEPPPEETTEPPPEETTEPPPEETEEEPQPQETTEPQPQEPEPTETESGTEPEETPTETEEQESELEEETEEPEGEDEEIPEPPLPDEAPPPPLAAAFYGPSGVSALQGLATGLLVLATGALVETVRRRGGDLDAT